MAKILCFRGISRSGERSAEAVARFIRESATWEYYVAADYAPFFARYTSLTRVRERGRVGASKRYLGLHASGRKERPATDKYSLQPGRWFVTSYRRGITALRFLSGRHVTRRLQLLIQRRDRVVPNPSRKAALFLSSLIRATRSARKRASTTSWIIAAYRVVKITRNSKSIKKLSRTNCYSNVNFPLLFFFFLVLLFFQIRCYDFL